MQSEGVTVPRKILALCGAIILLLAVSACSDDGDDESATAPTTTAESDTDATDGDDEGDDVDGDADDGAGDESSDDEDESGAGNEGSGNDSDTVDDGPCPAETELTIRNSDGIDGTLDPVTVFADVTLDATADLVVATYEIEEDPQFGISAPVGVPDVPDGGIIFQVALFGGVDQDLTTGVYVDDDEAEPRITFISLYSGDERILPLGDHTLTLTEISEDRLCGEITADTDPNELQSFPVVEGRFVAERV